jgi:large subunit ribosomal protein L17
MRHRVIGKKLSRDKDHRQALIKNLSSSIILNGKIETTLTKAKFIRPLVEKLITKAKDNSFNTLRILRTKINNEDALRKLITEVAPSFINRNGGYTRILKTGKVRKGDNAEMAVIELLPFSTSLDTANKIEKVEEEK